MFLSPETSFQPLKKYVALTKEKNNCVTHGTILCPGYEVNKLCFCKVFLQWVLHMVVFYCRNPISNPFQKVKLVNDRINIFVKVETIFCPGHEVIKTCLCKIFHQWVMYMFVFYCKNLFKTHLKKIIWGNNRINYLVKDETILCPGYKVIQICFCKIYLQWGLHKVVFYRRRKNSF